MNKKTSSIKHFTTLFKIEFISTFTITKLLLNILAAMVAVSVVVGPAVTNGLANQAMTTSIFNGGILLFFGRNFILIADSTAKDKSTTLYLLYKKKIITMVKLTIELIFFLISYIPLIIIAILSFKLIGHQVFDFQTSLTILFTVIGVMGIYLVCYALIRQLESLFNSQNGKKLIRFIITVLFVFPLLIVSYLFIYIPWLKIFFEQNKIWIAFVPIFNFTIPMMLITNIDFYQVLMPAAYAIIFLIFNLNYLATCEKLNIL